LLANPFSILDAGAEWVQQPLNGVLYYWVMLGRQYPLFQHVQEQTELLFALPIFAWFEEQPRQLILICWLSSHDAMVNVNQTVSMSRRGHCHACKASF